MNPHEEELQKSIEEGRLSSEENVDARAYEAVFRALRNKPVYEVPPGFAARVAARVAARREGTSRDYLWYGAGLLILLAAFIPTALYVGFRVDLGFLKAMADYKGLAAFGIAFIIFLNVLDRKLVRGKVLEGNP